MSYIVGNGLIVHISELLGEAGDQPYAFAAVDVHDQMLDPEDKPPVTRHSLMVFGEDAVTLAHLMKSRESISVVFGGRFTTTRNRDLTDTTPAVTEITAEVIGISLSDPLAQRT